MSFTTILVVLAIVVIGGWLWMSMASSGTDSTKWLVDLEGSPAFKNATYTNFDQPTLTAIGIIPSTRSVTLVANGTTKQYSYSDIRKWETTFTEAAKGKSILEQHSNDKAAAKECFLEIQVKDIDNPVWRISFSYETKKNLQKWMEILRQTLNEGKED